MAFSKKLSAVGPDSPTDITAGSVSRRIEIWEARGEEFFYRSSPDNDWLPCPAGKTLIFEASYTPATNLGQIRTVTATVDFYQLEI